MHPLPKLYFSRSGAARAQLLVDQAPTSVQKPQAENTEYTG